MMLIILAMTRFIRLSLLFGREFNLLDLLILWDAIFGIGDDVFGCFVFTVAEIM